MQRVEIDIWTFRQQPLPGEELPEDITGYSVEATDGSIGSIDEVRYDTGSSFVVADTGPWIFGRKVMLPAGVIERVDHDTKTVYVGRTKDEIKSSPAYDEELFDETYRADLGDYYRSFAD
jgi:hypothetical protein